MIPPWPFFYAAGLAVFGSLVFFSGFGAVLLPFAAGTALLLVVVVAAAGGGRVMLRAFGAREMGESERTLVGATLGLGVLSQAVFLLGMAGALKGWAVSALLGALWVVGFTEIKDLFRSLSGTRRLLSERPWAALAVFLPLAAAYAACFVPPHQYDALVYHLPLPAAYARAGRIVPVELVYSHFPQNAEMLYSLALLMGSDSLAQLFTWLGAFLSVGWIFEMGKREAPASSAALACVLASSHTALLLLASTAYVECLAMLWITACVLSFLRWRETAGGSGSSRGWLALSGVFAGLAVGTKYYAAITPAILGACLLWRWAAGGERKARMMDLGTFCSTAVLAGAPWLVKNWMFVGNPVFPFLYRWLPSRGTGWEAVSAARYFDMLTEYGHTAGTAGELAGFLRNAAFGSPRFGGGADILGSLGWGALLSLAPLAAWAGWRNRYMRGLCLYCLGHWAAWFCTRVVLRFLVVIVPLAALPAACGLGLAWRAFDSAARRPRLAGRALIAGGLLLVFLANAGFFVHVHALVGSLGVLSGVQSRSEFLGRKLDYYPCARFAAEHLGQNDRILIVGEQRGYYVEQPHSATSVMSPNRFVTEANSAPDGRGLALKLKEDGTRYILFVPREARRLGAGYGVFSFTGAGAANWAALASGLETVFEDPGRCSLARIP
jgi:hypothetical protein